jgi:hypothetical protein
MRSDVVVFVPSGRDVNYRAAESGLAGGSRRETPIATKACKKNVALNRPEFSFAEMLLAV